MSTAELKEWFKTAPAPQMPVYLNAATKVNDYAQFVNSHFEGIDAANNEIVRQPLIDRLLDMKLLIESNL
ncbi:MAG: hypothetical protein EOP49_32350 [Sphingobacteriales bacterium]|nr:MAG: hypothetical protein EOP49_32350 [Sphingobacteriales bacterium]